MASEMNLQKNQMKWDSQTPKNIQINWHSQMKGKT
jgi:hypothetical protein